jgi:transposase-like protein/IS1 family transposase
VACTRCQHQEAKKFGYYGRRRIQRYRCGACKSTFSAPRQKPLDGHYIEVSKAAQVMTLLLEGMSVRSTGRVTGLHQGTILSLLETVGKKARRFLDRHVRNLTPRFIEADELWAFVGCKERHLHDASPKEWGDSYTWLGVCAESKLIISYHVGKRDADGAYEFIRDLSERVVGRTQITTDGLKFYPGAIEQYFGADADYAQLIKIYGSPETEAPDWYQPSHVIETIPTPISGNPDPKHISTSYVERTNLSVRMHLRRFGRLTNAFSKKLANLKDAVSIFVAFFNFCRVHQTLRVTPAMQAGIADHVWTIQELLTWTGE